MWQSERGLFSNNQDVKANGNVVSTNVVDLGAGENFAAGDSPVEVVVVCTDGVNDNGSFKVEMRTGTGVDANGAINSGARVEYESTTFAANGFKEGDRIRIPFPTYRRKFQRYLDLRFVNGSAQTKLNVDAFLSIGSDTWAPQADATN